MRIGVFSDDMAGSVVALLAARGLKSLGDDVDVLAEALGSVRGAQAAHSQFMAVSGGDLADSLKSAVGRNHHVVAVFPLRNLSDQRLRSSFDVVLTAGRDHPASARALRAARYETSFTGTDIVANFQPPAWFVPCSHQVDLRTQATLASAGAVKLPFATRAIPFMVPRLQLAEVAGLRSDDLPAAALQTAVLLASIVVVIAADPSVQRIEAASVADLIGARATDRERLTSDRLLGLAAEYERLDAAVPGNGMRRISLPPIRRQIQTASPSGHVRQRRLDSALDRVRSSVR